MCAAPHPGDGCHCSSSEFPSGRSHKPPQFLPVDQRRPCHTIFLHNLDFNVTCDDIYHLGKKYGVVKGKFYPPTNAGMTLCMYFDLRDAKRAVKEGMMRPIRGRPVKTNFGCHRPHAKRDPKDI
jgi:RNA recognition motif-containing protein